MSDTRANKSWATFNQSAWGISVDEDVLIAEVAGKHPKKAIAEAFSIVDARKMAFFKNVLRLLQVSETYVDNIAFRLSITESLSISEVCGKRYHLNEYEAFSLGDHLARAFQLNKSEAIAVAESYARPTKFIRKFAESVGLQDKLARKFGLNKREVMAILDEYVRRANAIVSDAILGSGEMNLTQFTELLEKGHAPGYDNFKTFIQGDYEFRRAIYRVTMNSANSDRGVLKRFKVAIDVPDRFERGSVTILDANAGVYIEFAKPFYVPPEVTCTLKGGTVIAIPRVLDGTTTTGFTVTLQLSDGTKVTGTVSWIAQGY
ncbi:hypothetical protein [Cupriavidus campinensis]|uniref:Uncharacterized protein n=1 Tax=Cupriavidus campinensis TaxID=151783 RepID=A0ABY3ESK5_9BURK|nr:hypothetical protein [Cupriavidus campinensis]TSP13960.1 hypothetical protein FGG12_05675 [Cupriavidus campinensis]